MLSFNFKLNQSENQLHKKIESIMNADIPHRGIFNNKLFSEGIHFNRNDEIVSGTFLDFNEYETTRRGSPIRANFHGKIISTDDGYYFKGWIYPNPIEFIFITVIVCIFLYGGIENPVSAIIAIIVYAIFLWGFNKLSKECYKELEYIFSGK